ncbi:hypothetical protein I3842_07G059600 [Carya illinoinensis]|uniref:RRM domain-containing protein n=2 Tax=Carya illinoinensis TaxID=32201 RepID=A0A922JC71_CARIL|nr:hypothetical protein I3842_07G059600 [Carya illinoinensis]KAG6702921.1 hypothetical protein I3842_07G059600 [Carya illinoinensis]KAG6702922.1 hypothetical protein I3842_07G059600 [Carya illinoinensis]
MRTRNSDTPKSATPKKTPPSRKSATKTPPNPPEPALESPAPKPAETKRGAATKTKQVKKNETTPSPSASDSKAEGPSVAEEPKASADAAQPQVTPGTKVVAKKSSVKRMTGRTKTPVSKKAVMVQTPKSGDSDKEKLEHSQEENVECMGKDEATVENVGEPKKNEETVMESGKPTAENAGEPVIKEGSAMELDEPAVEMARESARNKKITAEVEEHAGEKIGGSAKKEERAKEVQVAHVVNVGGSSKQESVVARVGKSLENEGTDGAKEREVVMKEKEETGDFGNKEGTNVVSVNMEGKSIEESRGEDTQPAKDYGSDEGMEYYGDRLDLGEHGEEELAEDDPDEAAEDTEALQEERRELTAAAKERRHNKEHEIFVGGLDRDAEEEDLRKVFERMGGVVEVRLHKDPSTNKNKGYAFVKFANKEHAKRALSEMKNPVIRGKRCGTAPSEDSDTLFLGNICNTWTKEAIKQKLKEYGVEGVENITLVSDVQHEGLSRGFAFLEFSCHVDAMLAYKRLQKPDVIFGHPERTAKVAFADPLREPDPVIMAQVKSVFLDGLPPYWDEDHVREKLKGYGDIVQIVLARNMSTAKRKDFGFVDFSAHEAAVACVAGINSTQLGDGKVKVKARLSNPLPKTQAVKGGLCGGFRIGHGNGLATSNFGRGFGRRGQPFSRSNFQWNRGFYQGGRGQTGRMGFLNQYDFGHPHTDFHGRHFTGQGGRRDSNRGGNYTSGVGAAVAPPSRPNLDRPWHSAPDRGRGMHFPSRRQPYSPEGHFDRHAIGGHFDGPYLYDENGHGMKRPFYMTDHDSHYMEPKRFRSRLDYTDPSAFHGSGFHDNYGAGSSIYPHDYYGPDYGGGSYSSFHGSDRPYGGGYYY